MYTTESIEYIKNELANGLTPELIRYNLKSQDWTDTDIDESFEHLNSEYVETKVIPVSVDPIPGEFKHK